MKIILSTLPREGEYKSWITPAILEPPDVKHLPLGLVSLSTNVWDEHQPIILDPFSEHWDIDHTTKLINSHNPDVVGFSAITRRTYSLYRLLEKVMAPWKIVGGPHCTYHAEELLQHGADAVFVGPLAEIEFKAWLRKPVKGIIKCTTDINQILFPRRDKSIIDYEKYFYDGKVIFKDEKRMTMFSSIGCPNACSFCSVQSKMVQRKYPVDVVTEMHYLEGLGAKSVHIMDDNFNLNPLHITGILNVMENSSWDLPWSIRGQVKCNLSMIPKMAERGLRRIHVGIESLDDNVLRWMHKSHRVNEIEKFCNVIKESGVEMLAYLIVGCPGETNDYLKTLPEKIRKLGITQPYINILFPQPDTPYYVDLVKQGIYKKDHWADYFMNPIPDYEIPSPFGEERKEQITNAATTIIKEFTGL